jgi:hypothetical protein
MGHGEDVSLRMDNGPREGGPEEMMGPKEKKVPMEMIGPLESLGGIQDQEEDNSHGRKWGWGEELAQGKDVVKQRMGQGKDVYPTMDNGPGEGGPKEIMGLEKKMVLWGKDGTLEGCGLGMDYGWGKRWTWGEDGSLGKGCGMKMGPRRR